MKVLFRGQSNFTEVPDQPLGPTTVPIPTQTTTTSVGRGAEAPGATQSTFDHSTARADSANAPAILTTFDASSSAPATLSFSHTDAPAQTLTVASAVTGLQPLAMERGDLGGLSETGGGEIVRGSDALASLALDGPSYADHGWFVVPSASNEYGSAYAAADEFSFDLATGTFSADWFFSA